MHRISATGLAFIKGFESFVPHVYDDLVLAVRGRYPEWDGGPVRGTLTIGYGHTDQAKHPLKIRQGLRVTEEQALAILDADLDECEGHVNALVRVAITQGQFDALVSFTFNCGPGNLRRLIAPLNRGDAAGTRAAFDRYVKSKGVTLRGLVRRRDGEQALWDSDRPAMPEHPVDHPADVDADPTREPPANMAQSTTGNTAVLTGTGGVATVASEVAFAIDKVQQAGDGFSADALLMALATSPTFWISVFTIAASAYIWLERRAKLVLQGV